MLRPVRWWHLLLIAAGVGLWVWSPWKGDPGAVLPADADEVVLFSIDGCRGRRDMEELGRPVSGELLYDWPLLGKVTITDPDRRREVLAAVRADIRTGGSMYWCFVPRHVLRVTAGGRTTDLVLCFECGRYSVYDEAGRKTGHHAIGESSAPLLNAILTEAGVKLAPPPGG